MWNKAQCRQREELCVVLQLKCTLSVCRWSVNVVFKEYLHTYTPLSQFTELPQSLYILEELAVYLWLFLRVSVECVSGFVMCRFCSYLGHTMAFKKTSRHFPVS